MEAVVDSVGRIVLPKALRDAVGIVPGTPVDVSLYGPGLQIVPSGRTARLRKTRGALLGHSETVVTDDMVLGLIDSGRK